MNPHIALEAIAATMNIQVQSIAARLKQADQMEVIIAQQNEKIAKLEKELVELKPKEN